MTDPLSDRLSSFGADGPAPLAQASAVRARGAQRRARSRAALAGAGAVLLLAGGGTVAALGGGSSAPDRLDQAAPSARPTESAAPAVTAAQLLQPEDLTRLLGGGWTPSLVAPDAFSQLRVCDGPAPRGTSGAAHVLSRADRGLSSEAVRYDRPAEEVLADLRADVERCPSRPEGGGTVRHALLDAPAPGTALLSLAQDCPACQGRQVLWVAVAGPDGLVGYAMLPVEQQERAALWATAVRARLQGRAPDLTTPEPEPSQQGPTAPPSSAVRSGTPSPSADARPASELVLTVQDAQRAEPGDWRREGQDVEGPLLDPCTGGTDYPRDADVVDSAATELVARREAGGTSAVQTVSRYASAAAARDAADGYERAVRGCPTEVEDDDELGVQRSHRVVEEWSETGGVRTLYVRSESTCSACSTGYQYYAVQVAADAVSVVVVGHGEDGDPGDDVVRPFAREAAARLL